MECPTCEGYGYTSPAPFDEPCFDCRGTGGVPSLRILGMRRSHLAREMMLRHARIEPSPVYGSRRSTMYEDLDAWSRLLLDDPLSPPLFGTDRWAKCRVCGSSMEELRGIEPPDCGGCETCDQYFGGTYFCGNPECDQRKRALAAIPEEEAPPMGPPRPPEDFDEVFR